MADANNLDESFLNADDVLSTINASQLEEDPSIEQLTQIKNQLVSTIETRFYEAERGRRSEEQRWLEAYHNYRGVYGKSVKFRENEKSRVFIKITKTKVLAAYGQLIDAVFSGFKFPISISDTRVPEGIAKEAHLNPLKDQLGIGSTNTPDIEGNLNPSSIITEDNRGNVLEDEGSFYGYPGDGRELKDRPTHLDESIFLGGLEEEYTDQQGNVVLEEGPSKAPNSPEIEPSKIAARRMEKLIHDQIEESNGASELRSALFEATLLGTGVIKGPFNYNKTLHNWVETEEGTRSYQPTDIKVPKLEFVSVWDLYPDPNARCKEDLNWLIERHKLTKTQLRGLLKRPYFDKEAILECIREGYNYNKKDFENELEKDGSVSETSSPDRFEVYEYWGIMDAEFVRDAGLTLDPSIDDLEEVQINAWICNGKVIRIVLNPFKPYRLPYNIFPYEKNPYSLFGVGVAENMDDAQAIMNGHARMAIDNLALAGNLVLDVDEASLVPGQSMELHAGKIFRRHAGMPGQSIYGLKFPNTAPENMQMFDRFRQLADESTGIPSYSHGYTGATGMTRTASGMSMLMGAASLNIKTVVKNLDDFLLKPLGESFFQWNMQFYEGELNIAGDLEVRATGTNSLMQKEVRSQRLTMFLQTVQNPAIAPFVKIPRIVSELAYSLDLDPDEIINSQDEAAIYAEIIGLQNQGQSPQQQEMSQQGTDNGMIGTGAPPQPGEQGFSGNTEQAEAMNV